MAIRLNDETAKTIFFYDMLIFATVKDIATSSPYLNRRFVGNSRLRLQGGKSSQQEPSIQQMARQNR
jgi:hypothetical protein